MQSCHHGGFGGFVSFLITLVIAVVAYIGTMLQIEALRVFLDIEQSTRQTLTALRESNPPGASSTAPPPRPPA
jgi:hypothetical protein